MDRHHAARDAGVGHREHDRAVRARTRTGVSGGPALPDGRLRRIHLPHERLRRDVGAPADDGDRAGPLRTRGSGRPGAERPAFRRYRVRALRELR